MHGPGYPEGAVQGEAYPCFTGAGHGAGKQVGAVSYVEYSSWSSELSVRDVFFEATVASLDRDHRQMETDFF